MFKAKRKKKKQKWLTTMLLDSCIFVVLFCLHFQLKWKSPSTKAFYASFLLCTTVKFPSSILSFLFHVVLLSVYFIYCSLPTCKRIHVHNVHNKNMERRKTHQVTKYSVVEICLPYFCLLYCVFQKERPKCKQFLPTAPIT